MDIQEQVEELCNLVDGSVQANYLGFSNEYSPEEYSEAIETAKQKIIETVEEKDARIKELEGENCGDCKWYVLPGTCRNKNIENYLDYQKHFPAEFCPPSWFRCMHFVSKQDEWEPKEE